MTSESLQIKKNSERCQTFFLCSEKSFGLAIHNHISYDLLVRMLQVVEDVNLSMKRKINFSRKEEMKSNGNYKEFWIIFVMESSLVFLKFWLISALFKYAAFVFWIEFFKKIIWKKFKKNEKKVFKIWISVYLI